MEVPREVRIQLEGQLEAAEERLRFFRTAAEAFSSEHWAVDGRWHAGAPWVELKLANATAMRIEPRLDGFLSELAAAELAARSAAEIHLKALLGSWQASMSTESLLRLLEKEKPAAMVELSGTPPNGLKIILALTVATALFVGLGHKGIVGVLGGASVVALWLLHTSSRGKKGPSEMALVWHPVRGARVGLNLETARPLGSVVRVRWARQGRGWHLVFERKPGRAPLHLKARGDPRAFLSALEVQGIEVIEG